MKIALAIPTFNACGNCWDQLLKSVEFQTLQPDLKLIIDSSSTDQTVPLARNAGWSVLSIRKEEFNHGGTRRELIKYLHRKGYDAAILMTQDVILKRNDSFRKLVDFLQKNKLAGCCGRQISYRKNTLEQWQRSRCYPENSRINQLQDAEKNGLMTAFFSDAFAVWDIPVIMKYGAFPDTDFGEDTLLAANLLIHGEKTGYCAEAECIHEHCETLFSLWKRGVQIGKMHRKNPWFLKTFGKPAIPEKSKRGNRLAGKALIQFAAKSAGYLWGKTIPFL